MKYNFLLFVFVFDRHNQIPLCSDLINFSDCVVSIPIIASLSKMAITAHWWVDTICCVDPIMGGIARLTYKAHITQKYKLCRKTML